MTSLKVAVEEEDTETSSALSVSIRRRWRLLLEASVSTYTSYLHSGIKDGLLREFYAPHIQRNIYFYQRNVYCISDYLIAHAGLNFVVALGMEEHQKRTLYGPWRLLLCRPHHRV